MLAELRLPPLDGLVVGRIDGALHILFAYVVMLLAAASAIVVAITVLCVRRCRREGGVGADRDRRTATTPHRGTQPAIEFVQFAQPYPNADSLVFRPPSCSLTMEG